MKSFPTLRTIFTDRDPFESINRAQKEMEEWIGDLTSWTSPDIVDFKGHYPKLNILEKDKEYLVVAATPGMEKEELEVSYRKGILLIKGTSKNEDSLKNEKYICRELKKSSFVRAVNINEKYIDCDSISTSYKNGELLIKIPKKLKEEAIETRKIFID